MAGEPQRVVELFPTGKVTLYLQYLMTKHLNNVLIITTTMKSWLDFTHHLTLLNLNVAHHLMSLI